MIGRSKTEKVKKAPDEMTLFEHLDELRQRLVKAIIGPEMEKRLGRRLTELDWQVYRQEKADRERRAAWSSFMTRWQRRLIDRQIIRDFVWEGE